MSAELFANMNWFSPMFIASDVVLLVMGFLGLRFSTYSGLVMIGAAVSDAYYHSTGETLAITQNVIAVFFMPVVVIMFRMCNARSTLAALIQIALTVIGFASAFFDGIPTDPFASPSIADPNFLTQHIIAHGTVIASIALWLYLMSSGAGKSKSH
eukprot:Amastigsp_a514118_57.p1 type:complete len:155 gc:universal Amastigsp_a514118_57:554-90(-)